MTHDDDAERREYASMGGAAGSLGAALLQMATAIETGVEEAAETDIVEVLTTVPEPLELAELTLRLVTHCKCLAVGLGEVALVERSPRALGALRDWGDVASAEPEQDTYYDATSNLGYARMLALIARNMLTALRDHRAVRPAAGTTLTQRRETVMDGKYAGPPQDWPWPPPSQPSSPDGSRRTQPSAPPSRGTAT
ncbi:hypothetical protein [Streptomyces sp. NBC_00503]|uniref:hypothetical protein n=1 Tax=Streptomyces sp. NBC_00503 TaxID=2903659 RepID=UPI002E80678E|nr:hypothetical protein [Streptomyces sp. NBC_00503]WUD81987.1 hypothetical protein OG490_16350 [Streptomyces sp. NBC_00503]